MENEQPAQQFKTFIALPVYGIDPFFAQSVAALCADRRLLGGIRWEIGDSSPSRVRNTLVWHFLRSDCDQILFIDSDLVFTPDDILRITSHKEGVVGGFYFAKQEGLKPIYNSFEVGQIPPMREDGLQEVRYMGTGFLCIKRYVFEVMAKKLEAELAFTPDESPAGTVCHAYFEEKNYRYPNGHVRFLTEDWLFCQRCLDVGFKVWGDRKIVVKHRGAIAFPLESKMHEVFGSTPAPVTSAPTPQPVAAADVARQGDTASPVSSVRDITSQFMPRSVKLAEEKV